MDGIPTGEQVWVSRGQGADARVGRERMSIPRTLQEAERVARAGRAEDRGPLRRLAAWWVRGWTAFVAAMGEPYLSLGERTPRSTGDEPGEEGQPEATRGEGRRCA